MRYIDSLQNKINYHLLGTIFIIFTSCSLVKDVTTYSYYRGGIIQDDAEMLLFHIDSSYIFSNYSYGEKLIHREVGQYQIINDTIILYPQIETGSDRFKSFEYKGEAWYLTIRSDSVYAPPIKKRFYNSFLFVLRYDLQLILYYRLIANIFHLPYLQFASIYHFG